MRGRSKTTLVLESAIIDIVAERNPITVRGVCYGLFTQGLIRDMSKNETQKVSRVMTDMRERGDLDWTLVVDGSRSVDRIGGWQSTSQMLDVMIRGYRRDYWQDQPTLVEVWSEKSTVQGVLDPVLSRFGVTFRVMKGFGSYTSVRQAAEDSLDIPDDRQGVVLYIGDFDPSGLYMSQEDLPQRLARYGSQWSFERIAIQTADTKHLPSFDADTKSGDARHAWYVKRYGKKCWELDAMDPNDLRQRVREQIETRLDLQAWNHAIQIEQAEVESMCEFHHAWNQTK